MKSLESEIAPLIREVTEVFARMPADALVPLVNAILAADRILLYGQGRTGLVMQGLTMRLYHLGLDAHWVGAMATPPLGTNGLFLVNAARADLPTALALMNSARNAGAKIALIAGIEQGPAHGLADIALYLPAQTMAESQHEAGSRMPMGSQYEAALFFLCERLVLDLVARLGTDFKAMQRRHTNLL